MAPRDLALALLVVVAWGVNFVVIKLGLHGIPPMLLGALRFTLVAFPAILLVPRPKVPLKWLLAYGLTISLGQFACLFYAMHAGMPAGLASLVLQAQAFFTLLLAALILKEPLRARNLLGLAIASNTGFNVTAIGMLLTLIASSMWATGNIVTKRIGQVDMLGLVIWGALIPPLPFIGLSWWIEGPQAIKAALLGIDALSIFAIVYLAFISTLLGYSVWGKLLSRYPASQVAPFSLLVPVVGLVSASLLLGEDLTRTQEIGALLVMGGLLVSVFGRRLLPLMPARAG